MTHEQMAQVQDKNAPAIRELSASEIADISGGEWTIKCETATICGNQGCATIPTNCTPVKK